MTNECKFSDFHLLYERTLIRIASKFTNGTNHAISKELIPLNPNLSLT